MSCGTRTVDARRAAAACRRAVCVRADDGIRWLVVIPDRRPLAQEFRLETYVEIDAVFLPRTFFDDRPQHIFDGARHESRAEDKHVRRALSAHGGAQILAEPKH